MINRGRNGVNFLDNINIIEEYETATTTVRTEAVVDQPLTNTAQI